MEPEFPRDIAREIARARDEQNRIAGFGAAEFLKFRDRRIVEEFLDRRLPAVGRKAHVDQSAGTEALRGLGERIEIASRERGTAGIAHGRHPARRIADVLSQEVDRGARERRIDVAEFETEAQIGFVDAEASHRIDVCDPRDRLRDLQTQRRFPNVDDTGFHDLDDVVFVDERHLDIELREFRLAIGAWIFIAKTARDLHVAAEAADHEDLLEQLRRLWQRVKRAPMDAARHEEVARSTRRRFDEHGRFDFEKVARIEEVAHRLDEFVANGQVML